ncbi:hypothetical protein CAOG_009341 [Capsaspora owczarzaki ATCC 30864]|uniref:Uncharacterized protein n=1 Tax=Capsaspora owczarzaki (strain ATCC 30864) TaxID=595528 RepID=A0A0D2VH83_CAPO3|nr:hypothetical protein CAOG_009341 [Capsaspora owczarzaki ATCC 30864]
MYMSENELETIRARCAIIKNKKKHPCTANPPSKDARDGVVANFSATQNNPPPHTQITESFSSRLPSLGQLCSGHREMLRVSQRGVCVCVCVWSVVDASCALESRIPITIHSFCCCFLHLPRPSSQTNQFPPESNSKAGKSSRVLS